MRIRADGDYAVCSGSRQVLERDDLTLKQRWEIAKTLSTRAVTFEVSTESSPRLSESFLSVLAAGSE
ncbi:hypothetical protein ACT4ML_15510 [Natrinema sp. LN54]|uniref:hypothetical protein n=1 Tax=Natrinema sp. LN54 TaxID=3458705 RepID=UPI004036737D